MTDKDDTTLLPTLIRSLCDGVAIGWSLLLLILWMDIGKVGTLIDGSPFGQMAVAMLAAVFAITFGAAAVGLAVFSFDDTDDRT